MEVCAFVGDKELCEMSVGPVLPCWNIHIPTISDGRMLQVQEGGRACHRVLRNVAHMEWRSG